MRFIVLTSGAATDQPTARAMRRYFKDDDVIVVSSAYALHSCMADAPVDAIVANLGDDRIDGQGLLQEINRTPPQAPVIVLVEPGDNLAPMRGGLGCVTHVVPADQVEMLPAFVKQSVSGAAMLDKLNENNKRLRDSETRYRAIAELMSDYAFTNRVDQDGNVSREWTSEGFELVTGYDPSGIQLEAGLPPFIHPDDRPAAQQAREHVAAGEKVEVRLRIITKTGENKWLEYGWYPVWDIAAARVTIEYGAARDVTAAHRAEELAEYLTHYDDLTDLPNRSHFRDLLDQTLLHFRGPGHHTALLAISIDRLKQVVDAYGGHFGDDLVRAAAMRLWHVLGKEQTPARAGTDEFFALLPDLTRTSDAGRLAETILAEMNKPFLIGGRVLTVTASIGIALFPDDADASENLIDAASAAVNKAKLEGGNRSAFYAPAMNTRVRRQLELENELRQALSQSEYTVYYQPIVEAATERVESVEALLRWNRPGQGLVYPADFISAAEDMELVYPLGDWVLQTACTQCKAWQDIGFHDLRISVNAAPRQFLAPDFAHKVAQTLRETGLSAESLQVEITERVLADDLDIAICTVKQLRALGVQISLDDFGTGFSSLSYVTHFPVDSIKISQHFVLNMEADQRIEAVIRGTVALGHSLGLKVIAEGVEEQKQLDFLRTLGCEAVQGFLFSPALPPEKLTAWLEERRKAA